MTDKEKIPTVGQRFADWTAQIVRSWKFVIAQMVFIAVWIFINHHFPHIAWDDKTFDLLRLVLTIESTFIGSLLLMNQHHQSEKDRKIIYSDYILEHQIYKVVKELKENKDHEKHSDH